MLSSESDSDGTWTSAKVEEGLRFCASVKVQKCVLKILSVVITLNGLFQNKKSGKRWAKLFEDVIFSSVTLHRNLFVDYIFVLLNLNLQRNR